MANDESTTMDPQPTDGHAGCPNPECKGRPVVDGEFRDEGHYVAWVECSDCDWSTPRRKWNDRKSAEARVWAIWDRGRLPVPTEAKRYTFEPVPVDPTSSEGAQVAAAPAGAAPGAETEDLTRGDFDEVPEVRQPYPAVVVGAAMGWISRAVALLEAAGGGKAREAAGRGREIREALNTLPVGPGAFPEAAPEPIEFAEHDGTLRKIIWEKGDDSVGVPSGYVAEDEPPAPTSQAVEALRDELQEMRRWSLHRVEVEMSRGEREAAAFRDGQADAFKQVIDKLPPAPTKETT